MGFLNSNSLKLTKPLRVAGDVARKVKNNHFLKFARHKNAEENIHIYDTIKHFGIFDEAEYKKLHGNVGDAVLHFIEEGSKTDHIDDKLKYINPIFDLYYYTDHSLIKNIRETFITKSDHTSFFILSKESKKTKN